LSWIASDRSIAATARHGDRLLAGTGAQSVSAALLAMGRARPAVEVSTTAASGLRSAGLEGPAQMSVYGSLLLQGAVAAARIGEGPATQDLLTEATRAADIVGRDANYYWTSFGPTSVQLGRAATAVELGNGAEAVEVHKRLGKRRLARLIPERRADHYLTLVRAYLQLDETDQAAELLLMGDRLAPSEIRCRPLAHEVLSDVLRRTRGHSPRLAAELESVLAG
jgi:hypothetical protein